MDRPYKERKIREDLKRCALCGRHWDECEGECQDWITKDEKVSYLRMIEQLNPLADQEIEKKILKEKDDIRQGKVIEVKRGRDKE